jgi:hypothetical protein
MIHIYGIDKFPALQVFEQVAPALEFDKDIYLGAQAVCFLGEQDRFKGHVIYNMEPLYDGCRPLQIGYMDVLKNNVVLDYSAHNVEFLKHIGVEAFHLPYGLHDGLKRFSSKPIHEQDIDVLFVGSFSPRRDSIINELARRHKVTWAQSMHGVELDDLCSRARVHLNIHGQDRYLLEVVRLNYLLANGQNIVSEPGIDEDVNMLYKQHVHLTYNLEQGLDDALSQKQGYTSLPMHLKMNCHAANAWLNLKG